MPPWISTLLTLLDIPGVGPKTVGRLYRELGITDLVQLERALEASALRRDEINLRGELHRADLGEVATALLDPLHAIVDCPRQNTCVARALRRIWAEP